VAFQLPNAFGTRYVTLSGLIHTAHRLACLRINDTVTAAAARLATDPGGLAPGRAGFAPAGRRFEVSWRHRILLSPSTSLAWSLLGTRPFYSGLLDSRSWKAATTSAWVISPSAIIRGTSFSGTRVNSKASLGSGWGWPSSTRERAR